MNLIEFFRNKLMNLLNLMTKKTLQSKGFDQRILSVEGQCAHYYTIQPSVKAIIFKSMTITFSLCLNGL